MLFNSKEFLLFFLPVVLCIYWLMNKGKLKWQNMFLLISSYFFYSWWDWRFLFLLMLSTLIDYYFGIKIQTATNHRKLFLWTSVICNLAILGFFKYFNFFADSFTDLVNVFGMDVHPYVLQVALPVGISFYTFHGMSYVFDIYNGKTTPTYNFVDYALFVCFFPLLVAGPIERATHLLPQVKRRRQFNSEQSIDGIKMMLWGFFKKVVVADSIAPVVNNIFDNYQQYSGATLIFGAILFSIQIYGDFSGYTDIALGTAKLFGFELLTNFRFPYFSRDIAEFWKRWHISLSSWFRDYLYIPLGGSKRGKAIAVRNTFIIFLVSGFWHGANWTFIVWGLFHALLFLPLLLFGLTKKNLSEDIGGDGILPGGREFGQMVLTFSLVTVGWIFFRAPDISTAFGYLERMVTNFNLVIDQRVLYSFDLVMIAILIIYDYMLMKKLSVPRFAVFVFHVFLSIAILGSFIEDRFANQFIYFQF